MKFFYFLKIIFNISTISTLKQPENIKKNYFKQKKFKIFNNVVQTNIDRHLCKIQN